MLLVRMRCAESRGHSLPMGVQAVVAVTDCRDNLLQQMDGQPAGQCLHVLCSSPADTAGAVQSAIGSLALLPSF